MLFDQRYAPLFIVLRAATTHTYLEPDRKSSHGAEGCDEVGAAKVMDRDCPTSAETKKAHKATAQHDGDKQVVV